MSQPSGPPKLINVYNLRQVGTAKSCFVCSKETVFCLATADLSDFLYVCHSHVLDPGFAKPITTPASTPPTSPTASPAPPAVPQSEIDKVKREYEQKQKRKQSDPTTPSEPTPASSSSSSTTATKALSVLKSSVSSISSLAQSTAQQSSTLLFPPPAPVIPSASELLREEAKRSKQFSLNRHYFEMRCDRKRKEWEVKDAKSRAKTFNFPKVPQGGLPNLSST
ncbi:AAA-ATPase Vps4-associated 1 family protein [Sporobolomyces koalae]|uniref:AAA-ATPase Vps4-associated 1 family protein n=1 Tax=Sporobolomyces koalae TaxID=500713 RepID=UPI00317D79C7